MSTATVTAATSREDIAAVSQLIATAFDDLALNHNLIPEPGRRIPAFTQYFAMLAEHAAGGAGRVLLATAGHAAAVCFDRRTEASEPDDYADRVERIAGPYAGRFAIFDTAFAAAHPAAPHWYIAFVAVDRQQGRGLGSALMTHLGARLDEQTSFGYLEATNRANRRLYARYRFGDMTAAQFTVGDPSADTDGTTVGAVLHRMWCEPIST